MSAVLAVLNHVLRWALWSLAGVLIIAALYVSLGRQLVPLVAEYQKEIEQGLQDTLQQPVQIEQLEGGWRGFSPLLAARYVTLGEGEGALQVEKVQIQLDMLASLWARALRFKAVTLTGLQVQLSEDEAGQWALQGMRLQDTESTSFQLNDALINLQNLGQVSVLDSRVIVQAYAQAPLALTYAGFTLSHLGSARRLDLRALLPDGEALELSAQGHLIEGDWRKSALTIYLKTPSSNLAQWIPSRYLAGWQLEGLTVAGEFWLQAVQGQLQAAVVRLEALQLQAQTAEAVPLQIASQDALVFYQQKAGVQRLWFEQLRLEIDDLPARELRAELSYSTDETALWQLAVEALEVADVHYLVERLASVPDVAADVLQSMQPGGRLQNVQLQWRPDAVLLAERLTFVSNVEDVAFSAWHDVPAASGINGYISGDLAQGELRLASETGFSLHLASLFAEPWQYHSAHAQLLWHFDAQGFTLRSPYLQVTGEEGEMAGDFLIRLLTDPDAEDYMDLRVGLRDGDARFTAKYLPTRVPDFSANLSHWLTTAIQAGQIDQGYFQYQGALSKGAPAQARSLSLYFAVQDALLEYQPGWPALTEAAAQVLIEDSGVRIHLQQGKILNSPVTAATAEVKYVAADQVPALQLHAELDSSMADALYFLQKTPIAQDTLEFSQWQGRGSLPIALDLTVPLAAQQPIDIKLALAAQGVELDMPDIDVQLRRLTGHFVFDNQRGLSAKKVTGQFLGQTFSGDISAAGQAGALRSHIDVRGLMPLERLVQWGKLTQSLPVTGDLPYRLRILLEGDDSQLRLDSNLLGVKVDLPAPFAKAANQESYADWRMTLAGNERRYWFDYADQLSLSLAATANDLLGGRAQIRVGGGLARLPTQAGLQVRGRLNNFDFDAWQQVSQRYMPKEQTGVSWLKSAKLDIRRFNGFGLQFEHLNIDFQPQTVGWRLALKSARLQGQIIDPGAQQPLQVHLAHLYVPAAEADSTEQDALADFDMRSIPALNIQLDALHWGEHQLGAWSFQTRPQAKGVLFDQLKLSFKGLNMTGQLGWERVNGQVSSWYKGRLSGDNLSDVLSAWGFAPSISSQAFRADNELRWPGSPAAFSLKKLSGDVGVQFNKGQLVSVEGTAQALRVFGLLNFESIGRRLRFDFSDLFGKGLAYDRIKGQLQVSDGVYRTASPLYLTGPSSNFELQGQLDALSEQVKATLLVTLPLTNNLPLAAIAVGAPVVGGALFIVDQLMGDRLSRFASVTYHISGDWQQPNISLIKK